MNELDDELEAFRDEISDEQMAGNLRRSLEAPKKGPEVLYELFDEMHPEPSAKRGIERRLASMKAAPGLGREAVTIQKRVIDRVKANPQAFVDEQRSRFGDHFNPDNAAELFPEYASSPENRAKYRIAVGGAAGWVTDEAFRQRLAEPDHQPVMFTAGGTASGKSTLVTAELKLGYVVLDTTFSNYELSKHRLNDALASGRDVEVHYLYRDPLEAWDWANIRTANEGAGRTVTTTAHALTHKGAATTVARLAEEFKDNPAVEFRFYENSAAHGLVSGNIELTQKAGALGLKKAFSDTNKNAAPPLHPLISREELAAMPPKERADYSAKVAMSAIARYGGRPDLMLRENPHLDFRNPPKKGDPAE